MMPGGKLILTTPNFASLVNILLMIKCTNPTAAFTDTAIQNGQPAIDSRVHPREYTVKEIASSLEKTGFHISKIDTACHNGSVGSSWKLKLVNLAMKLTPCHRDKIIAIAEKQAVTDLV